MKTKSAMLCLAVSALISGFTVILPDYIGFLGFISMTPACYVFLKLSSERERKLRSFYGLGLLYFFCFYLLGWHFFCYMYPLDFTGINNFFSVLVIFVAWFGLSLLQALIGALMLIPYGYLVRRGFFKKRPLLAPVIFTALYVTFEWIQTLGWWGVPWMRLSLSQSSFLPFIATSSLFGSYFVTAVLVLINSSLAFAFMQSDRRGFRTKLFSAVALISFAINLAVGGISIAVTEESLSKEETVRVAVIQGNFSSKTAYDASSDEILDVYEEYTEQAALDGAKLIIWPETALPYNVKAGGSSEKRVAKIAKENSIDILYGALRDEDETVYNCLFHADKSGKIDTTIYKKRHLVPFGEYVPMRNIIEIFLPFMSEISMLSDDMTPGEDTSVFDIEGVGEVGGIICFDSIYEELTLASVRDGAKLLALGTNDSWFSNSVAIYLHNNQARFRSVETGRYTVRAAVTGVCSVISPTGEILGKTEPLERDYLVADVVLRGDRTFYSYIGNLFVYLCIALLGFTVLSEVALGLREKRRSRRTED